jgi:hypothetical protein
MRVMTARMHHARTSRCIVQTCFFRDRQRVDIGPQSNAAIAVSDMGHNARAGNAAVGDAEFVETTFDEGRCLELLEREFGVSVQVTPSLHKRRKQLAHTSDDVVHR